MQIPLQRPSLNHLRALLRGMDDDERRQYQAFGEDVGIEGLEAIAEAMDSSTISHLWTHNGFPIGAAGFDYVTANVLRSWMIVTSDSPRHWAEITRTSRAVMDGLLSVEGITRLETWCLADRAQARAWYEKLGLKLDGVLPRYGRSGEAVAIYSKTKEP